MIVRLWKLFSPFWQVIILFYIHLSKSFLKYTICHTHLMFLVRKVGERTHHFCLIKCLFSVSYFSDIYKKIQGEIWVNILECRPILYCRAYRNIHICANIGNRIFLQSEYCQFWSSLHRTIKVKVKNFVNLYKMVFDQKIFWKCDSQ